MTNRHFTLISLADGTHLDATEILGKNCDRYLAQDCIYSAVSLREKTGKPLKELGDAKTRWRFVVTEGEQSAA